MTFDDARARFPVCERLAYLNAGTCGPLSRATFEAMNAELEHDLEAGRSGMSVLERMLGLRDEVVTRIAALVHAPVEHVAMTSSTTDGCNVVLAGLDLETGDEIITTTDEHFGLLGPLHASGAHVVVADPDPEAILAAVTPRTRLVAVSHVLWTTGQILPVHELRARSGVPILVDGAQSAGAIDVDTQGLDYYTVSGQKWLCGPDLTGALVVADPELLPVARPSYFAQLTHEPDGSFEPRAGAERFQPNRIGNAALAGLAAALDDLPERRYERAFAQAEKLRERLADRVDVVTPAQRATLVSFRMGDGAETTAVVERLAREGVVIRDLPGRGLLRASVGWWTNDDDLERLASAL